MTIKKFFLSILSAPIFLTTLQVNAEGGDVSKLISHLFYEDNEVKGEHTLVKSPFSFDYFIGFPENYNGGLTLGYGRFGFGYKPLEDNDLIMNVSLEHFFDEDENEESSSLGFENKFLHLRWSAGYEFVIDDSFSITPSLGLAINLDDSNTTQGYTNIRFDYNMTNKFGLFVETIYDFGSSEVSDMGTIGFGFKYTPYYKKPVVNQPSNKPVKSSKIKPVTSKFGNVSPIIETRIEKQTVVSDVEQVTILEDTFKSSAYEKMPFTIQIAAVRNTAEVNAFRKRKSINPNDTYVRKIGGLLKIYYKGYTTLKLADQTLANLKAKGIRGFVLNTPTEDGSTSIVVGTFHTIQLGSFSSLRLAESTINKLQMLDKQTFVKESDGKVKLYTGKFTNKSEAQAELIKLKAKSVNGFVTKVN